MKKSETLCSKSGQNRQNLRKNNWKSNKKSRRILDSLLYINKITGIFMLISWSWYPGETIYNAGYSISEISEILA